MFHAAPSVGGGSRHAGRCGVGKAACNRYVARRDCRRAREVFRPHELPAFIALFDGEAVGVVTYRIYGDDREIGPG